MASPYELDELLDDRNRPLYEEVIAAVNVQLETSEDSGWGCKLEGRDGIIYCNQTKYPIACFTHELLHLKFQGHGMECPLYRTDDAGFPAEAIGFFHNQLVHHKIYEPFIALGFPAQEFLNDADGAKTVKMLNRDLTTFEALRRKSPRPLTGLMVAMPFFTVNSPHDKGDAIKRCEKRLKAVADPKLWADLEKILRDWRLSQNPNCSRPLAYIFKVAGYPRVGFTVTGLETDTIYAANVTI